MANSNQIISTTNIRTSADVASVLGVATRTETYLCRNTHGKTNIWSKYKPVAYKTVNGKGITEAQWKGVAYGMSIKGKTRLNGFEFGSVFGESTWSQWATTPWIYTPPSGGESEPCRLGDFRDYNHNARTPCRFLYKFNNDGVAVVESFVDFTQSDSELHVGDIFDDTATVWLREKVYLCMVAMNGSSRLIITSSEPITRSTTSVRLLITLPSYGTWKMATGLTTICVPTLSDISEVSDITHASFYPLMMDDPSVCAYENKFSQAQANFYIEAFGFNNLKNWTLANGLKGTLNYNGILEADIITYNNGSDFLYNYQLVFGIKVTTKTAGYWALSLPSTIILDKTFGGGENISVNGTWMRVASGNTGVALKQIEDDYHVEGTSPAYYVFKADTLSMHTAFPLAREVLYTDIDATNPKRGQELLIKVDLGKSNGQLLAPAYLKLSN